MNSKPINSAHCDYSAYSSDDDFDNNGIRGQTKRPTWFTEEFSCSTCEPGESSQAATERAAAAAAAKRARLQDKASRSDFTRLLLPPVKVLLSDAKAGVYQTICCWLNEKSVAWAAEEGISSEETRQRILMVEDIRKKVKMRLEDPNYYGFPIALRNYNAITSFPSGMGFYIVSLHGFKKLTFLPKDFCSERLSLYDSGTVCLPDGFQVKNLIAHDCDGLVFSGEMLVELFSIKNTPVHTLSED